MLYNAYQYYSIYILALRAMCELLKLTITKEAGLLRPFGPSIGYFFKLNEPNYFFCGLGMVLNIKRVFSLDSMLN